jgi:hypothetical protein
MIGLVVSAATLITLTVLTVLFTLAGQRSGPSLQCESQ